MISICIPAYRRPGPLREALESCASQTCTEFEILIGDDSPDDLSAAVAAEFAERLPGKVFYEKNQPSLGQAANVNRLFDRARGERLVLLHDDDLLLPDALSLLASCWNDVPDLTAAFGKQYIVNNEGVVLSQESDELNLAYHRISSNAGQQTEPAIAGLLRMFPNNGYMVVSDVARRVRYRMPEEVGEACDADFGLRVCLAANSIWFVDEYVAKYRISTDAISKRNYPHPFTYEAFRQATLPPSAWETRRRVLRELAPAATSGYARLSRPGRAMRIYLSENYPLRERLTIRGLYHLFLIAAGLFRKVLLRKAAAVSL